MLRMKQRKASLRKYILIRQKKTQIKLKLIKFLFPHKTQANFLLQKMKRNEIEKDRSIFKNGMNM